MPDQAIAVVGHGLKIFIEYSDCSFVFLDFKIDVMFVFDIRFLWFCLVFLRLYHVFIISIIIKR